MSQPTIPSGSFAAQHSFLNGQVPWRHFRDAILPPPVDDPEAQELYDAYSKRAAHVKAIDDAERDAQLAVDIAHAAYQSELARAANEGVVSEIDGQLLAAREQAIASAHPELHQERREGAQALLEDAKRRYLRHVDLHALAYIAALEPEAVKVATEIAKVQADAERKLKPLQARHAELVQAHTFLLGGTVGLERADIENTPGLPVSLKADARARLQPEPVEPESGRTTIGAGVEVL
jgi:hypothetical protein